MPTDSLGWARPRAGAGDLDLLHGGRHPGTCAILCYFPGCILAGNWIAHAPRIDGTLVFQVAPAPVANAHPHRPIVAVCWFGLLTGDLDPQLTLYLWFPALPLCC